MAEFSTVSMGPGTAPAGTQAVAAVPLALDRVLLGEVLALIVPAWAAVAAGAPAIGGYWYYSVLTVLFLWHWAHKQPHRISGLLLATLPAMGIFRNYFYYNSPQVYYFLALVLWIEYRRRQFSDLMRDRLVVGLTAFSVVYWLLSFLITGEYSANFRALELSLSVASVALLYTEASTFRTALLGVGLGILIQGVALRGYGERLGFGTIDGATIGNPISFGLPAAVLFLLSVIHDGRWILVSANPVWRAALTGLSGIALLLSTSRGSWLVATVGLIYIFLFDKKQRPMLVGYLILMVVMGAILTQTQAGETFAFYLDRTFGGDISLDKRTTGRAEQWAAFPSMLAASPFWGHGAGTARDVAAEYAGRFLALHALYLQIGAELGLIGLGLVAWFAWYAFRRGWFYLHKLGEPVPLLGVLCYFTAAFSVPAIDATTGLFLSLGLIRIKGRMYRVVNAAPAAAAVEEPREEFLPEDTQGWQIDESGEPA